MLLRSLRLRILLTFTLVLIAAIGTTAFTVQQLTMTRFEQYVVNVDQQNQLAWGKLFTAYRQTSDPAALQQLVDQVAASGNRRVLFVDQDRHVIADSAHQLVGQILKCPSPGDPTPSCVASGTGTKAAGPSTLPADVMLIMGGPPMGDPPHSCPPIAFSCVAHAAPAKMQAVANNVGGPAVPANVVSYQSIALSPTANQEEGFIRAINRSLILSAVLGGALALLLTGFLSMRILRPVQALTAAVREMERGDFAQRVPVRGKDELGVLAHAFNAMADSVARAERLRRTMLGDVAHDLRTPLTNIRGYLEAIQDGVVRPTPSVIRSLHDEASLLTRLAHDLQELAQAEAGQLHFDCRPLDLVETLRQVAAVMAPQAQAKGVRLDVHMPPDLPPVLADAERVSQVLGNLLQNAITYTPEGGRVTLSAVAGPPVEVCVADTGGGIPPEHLPNIFERFYRADRSRSRATGGSGLGLAIVKQLVERQGGRVAAESTVGQGSIFRFTLPCALAAEPALGSSGPAQ